MSATAPVSNAYMPVGKSIFKNGRILVLDVMELGGQDSRGARPADHVKDGPAPLLRALESFRWR